MSDLAASLRRLRERARLTQEELAARAGVSTRTVSDIERALRVRVYADTASRLAVALALDGEDRERFVDLARGRAREVAASGHVPHPLTALIGRDTELVRLVDALQPTAHARLVTVTGLGGSGKTRLALAAARQVLQPYADRVWFVPLVADAAAKGLAGAVARVFRTELSRLAATVGDRPALLLVDGFEHVLPDAPLLGQLLAESSTLHVVVTSRVALHILGERELPLGPLPPDDAARLFLDRARGLVPDLDEDASALADICRLTSGLPLPIELAAAHVRYLPMPLLRDRLRHGLHDVNRVVEDAVAWSIESLSDAERQTLAAAAIFVAGCRLDALQVMCPGVDVIRSLGALSDKGLVVLQRGEEPPRWRMLDTVREAVGRLRPADRRSRDAYTDFYLKLLDELDGQVGNEQAWYRVLAAEEPNIVTALEWADAHGDADTLLALATGLWQFWQARGGLDEGRRWLARGLDGSPPPSDSLRLTALWALAWLAYHQGDDQAAADAGADLGRLAAERGDDLARRNAATIAGMVAIARDDAAAAVEHLRDALEIARRVAQPWILATSLLNLALGHLAAGSVAAARPLLGEALHGYERIGDLRFHARCIGYLGLAALLDGDPERARALFRRSLTSFGDLGEPAGIAEGLAGLACVAAATGRHTDAATLAGAAERLRRTVAARELPLERRVSSRYLGAAEQQLGAASWDEAWRRGQHLTTEEALAQALEENDP